MNATKRRNGKAAVLRNPKKKPQRIEVLDENFPDALKFFDRWIVWRWTWNAENGCWDKPPINARTGKYASTTVPETWCDYRTAMQAADEFDGVGFVLGPDDSGVHFSGADFDDCRDPDTSDLDADIAAYVRMLGSYTEVSPSQTGVKVFCLGKYANSDQRNGSTEPTESTELRPTEREVRHILQLGAAGDPERKHK